MTLSYKTRLHDMARPRSQQDRGEGSKRQVGSVLAHEALPLHCALRNPDGESSPQLTPGRHQDLAVDGTPANGVDIHGSQVTPEVMAGIVFKAFIPEQHPVP